MAASSPHRWSESEVATIRNELARIVKSGPFEQSDRRQRFLNYIVTEALEGRADRLKGYSIGVEVFDKPVSFDPLTDPVVRVEAARLRDKLREFYDTEGQGNPVRIDIPKGSYVPQIEVISPPTDQSGPSLSAPEPAKPEPSPRLATLHRPIGISSAIVSAVILLLVGWSLWRQPTPAMMPRSERLSLAVMPFENIGDDPAWRRLADGMTEDITTDLSQSKDLLVIARNSTEVYRNKTADVRSVGRDLGVRYVLQGSIQPTGNRIRVTVRLIDIRSGENVWSTRYNRSVADIFEVQSAVTDSIVATLTGYEGAVAQAERTIVRRKPPSVLTAYEHYLLGTEAKHGGASVGITEEGLQRAERHFLKALEIDPQLARAYVALSYVYEYRLDLNIGEATANVNRLVDVANSAVQLDPNDGEAQMVLGHAYAYQGLGDKALRQFARAEALAPSNADVLILIAWYLPQLGQVERAVGLAERALRLNPNYPAWYNQGFRYVYFFSGAFEKSAKFVKLVPNPNPLDFAFLAMASAMLNEETAARAAAEELRRRDAAWNVEAYLSDNGGFPEKLTRMIVEAARKAAVPLCAPAEKLNENLAFVRLAACDEERVQQQSKTKAGAQPTSQLEQQ